MTIHRSNVMSKIINFPRTPNQALRVWKNAIQRPMSALAIGILLLIAGMVGHISFLVLYAGVTTLSILLVVATIGMTAGITMHTYRRYLVTTKSYIYMMWFGMVGGALAYILILLIGLLGVHK
jgi:hypothetical protein